MNLTDTIAIHAERSGGMDGWVVECVVDKRPEAHE